MSEITDHFLEEAKKREILFNSEVIESSRKDKDGNEVPYEQSIFHTALRLNKNKIIRCSVFIHDTNKMDYVDYHITYSRIGIVTDRNELNHILEEINELNLRASGYYHFVVSEDGILHMRNLGIIGKDPIPALNVFLGGGIILKKIIPELEKIKGLDISNN